jgi:hypothetical protein
MGMIINPYRFSAAYDTDYQAVLDRATALGYTHPGTTKKTKENAAMIAIKAVFGVSSIASAPILQGLMFKTDGSSDYATLNWASPSTRQATKVNSPTFTSDVGFNSNGTSSYLTSGFNTTDITDQSNFSLAVRAHTNTDIAAVLTGAGDAGEGSAEAFMFFPRASDSARLRVFNGVATADNIANTDATNRFIIGRTDSSNNHRSINGAAFTNLPRTFNAADITRDIVILAYSGNAGVVSFFTSGVSYRWVFSRKLTDAEAAAFDTAMVNYLS